MKKIAVITFLYLFSFAPSFGFTTGPDTIINGLKYTDLSSYLKPIFIKAYGKAKSDDIGIEQLLFSPKGRYLAFKLSQIHSGDPEQVWFIDLETKKCRCVTDKCTNKIGITIYHMEWVSEGELKVWYNRNDIQAQTLNGNFVVSASMGKRVFTKEKFPEKFTDKFHYFKKPTTKFQLSYLRRKSRLELKNLITGRIQCLKMRNFYFEDLFWTEDEKYFVYSQDYGHGFSSIFAGTTTPIFSIKKVPRSGFSLLGFTLSPNSPIIVCSADDEHSLIIYDLARRQTLRRIKTGFWPMYTALSNNYLLAFESQDVHNRKINYLQLNNKLYIVKLK